MNNNTTNSFLDFLSHLQEARSQELTRLKKDRALIAGYLCNYTPPEIIEACGGVPVRIMQNIHHGTENIGKRYIQRDSCSYCKAVLGSLLEHPNVSCIVSGTTCDQMRRTNEYIAEKSQIPVFLFANPRTYNKPSTEFLFKRELKWVIAELTALTGTIFSGGRLIERIKQWNTVRRFLLHIHSLRKSASPPITGWEMFRLIDTAFFLGPEQFLPYSRKIEECITSRTAVNSEKPLRILFAGSIVSPDDEYIFNLIEGENSAVVVTDIVCTGVRWFCTLVKEDGDGINTIYSSYHRETVCPHRRPNEPLFAFTKSQIQGWKPDGIIYRTHTFCHPWAFETQTFKKRFPIPLLHFDTDYSHSNINQIRTRIRAFFEMIDAKRVETWHRHV
jgi:benzoyl-CoA reductase/2-hydroxyglutaryl-CoA dehydratase subunit BcrC/BadD/HgdB